MYNTQAKNKMNYSSFKPSIEYDPVLVDAETKIITRRSDLIREHAQKNNLIQLKCDYFGMDSYYYHKETKTMYKVCIVYDKYRDCSIIPIFEVSNDEHILTLNHIPSNDGQVPLEPTTTSTSY